VTYSLLNTLEGEVCETDDDNQKGAVNGTDSPEPVRAGSSEVPVPNRRVDVQSIVYSKNEPYFDSCMFLFCFLVHFAMILAKLEGT
jgi:hypothetical protein